jgi:tetratricopeptide (TPR) repeat protein
LEKYIEADPHPAEYWNEKGVVYGCLKNMTVDKYPSKQRPEAWMEDETDIYCYDKAIEIDPNYAEAWNNKGLAYIEGAVDMAVKCFLRAIECARMAGSSNEYLADIYNNLGVAYYQLKDNVKALESFDAAIKLEKDSKLAENNKFLTVEKIGKRRKIYKADGSETYE